MENYISKVIATLSEQHISCCYNDKEHLLYSEFKYPWGDVFSIYEYEDNNIINYSIYDIEVPEYRMKSIFEYLDQINDKITYGYFYVDPKINKITFGVDYGIENMTDDDDGRVFRLFSLLWYNVFLAHGEHLYQIATDKAFNIHIKTN